MPGDLLINVTGSGDNTLIAALNPTSSTLRILHYHLTAPADSLTMNGTVVLEELG